MKIDRNMHPIDQILRILLGIALIYIGFFNGDMISDTLFRTLLGGFGVINLVSGLMAVCPVYLMAGISTSRKISHSQ
jgi:hypothetical protein